MIDQNARSKQNTSARVLQCDKEYVAPKKKTIDGEQFEKKSIVNGSAYPGAVADESISSALVKSDPVRRHYNQWVNNETLEDYGLRFTALKSRRWSCLQVASTALGSISFLALEAIGAAITLQYGWINAVSAIGVVSLFIFALGVPIAFHAAKAGVDIDLLTRGAGFGYLGSTITSLIYAGFTFIYFALEAAIMATALKVCFGIPLSVGYLLSSLVIIPVVVYGITMISRLQHATQHIWLVLQLAPFVFLGWQSVHPMKGWDGLGFADLVGAQPFDWVMFGAASAVVFSLTVQIGEQVDYLRFLPVKTPQNQRRWWVALISAGPGWIVIGAIKMLAGAYLCLLALKQGMPMHMAVDPVHMYLNAWAAWLSPELALAVTGVFVIICQFKINITNSYAGSIAWSNFFSRLTHSHPGRVVWLVFNVTIAWMLMELGVYASLENTLSLYSILGVSWIGAIAVDLAINKKLGLSPAGITFKRAQLYDINPVGVGGMALATGIGLIAYSGVWGVVAESMATYVALLSVLILVPLLAYLTGGMYYLARNEDAGIQRDLEALLQPICTLCRNEYDKEDLIHCPAHKGTICSLCCSLDARCEDQCRPDAPFLAQLRAWTSKVMPERTANATVWLVVQFVCLLVVVAAVMAFIFGLVYLQVDTTTDGQPYEFSSFIQKLFSALLLLAAIVTWMYLLASESARRAREDTLRQNVLLQQEITAHEITEHALHRAREKAEAANEAKSRYVIGLSHELRTPLNSILGYAQLMEQDVDIPAHRQNGVRVIKDSTQHLAGLIENLLDISKIEADRLTIHRDQLDLHQFLHQLVQMFRIQAQSSALAFTIDISAHVPRKVFADEKRLRQILINLLSNAFRYTDVGTVALSVDYRSQVTTFKVSDTGPGMSATDLERIYQPFETLHHTNTNTVKGTGLGLTISKLLAGIMGGDLNATSVIGEGSCFVLKLLLPPIMPNEPDIQQVQQKYSKLIAERTVVVVDDDVNHRALMEDYLTPIGFKVVSYANAHSCLVDIEGRQVDVFLLDISMPGMDGWDLARQLRKVCIAPVRILMVSALADDKIYQHAHDSSSKNYFVKPLDFNKLLARLQEILELDFEQADIEDVHQSDNKPHLPFDLYTVLKDLYTIGHVSAINDALSVACSERPESAVFARTAIELLERHQLDAFESLLESAVTYHDK